MEATIKVITDGCGQGCKRDEDGLKKKEREKERRRNCYYKNPKLEVSRQNTRRKNVKRKA